MSTVAFHDRPTGASVADIETREIEEVFQLPGFTDNVRLKTEGKALPQGAIVGAIPRFALDELHDFASLCNQGCSKHLSTWEFPL